MLILLYSDHLEGRQTEENHFVHISTFVSTYARNSFHLSSFQALAYHGTVNSLSLLKASLNAFSDLSVVCSSSVFVCSGSGSICSEGLSRATSSVLLDGHSLVPRLSPRPDVPTIQNNYRTPSSVFSCQTVCFVRVSAFLFFCVLNMPW